MKKLTLTLTLLFIIYAGYSQDNSDLIPVRAQSAFLEVGGPSLIVGANYDTRFSNTRNGLGGRLGVGYISIEGDNVLTIPVMLNYLLGKQKNYFEVGLGTTFASARVSGLNFGNNSNDETVKGSNFIGTSVFGYRYQPLDDGFQFRAGLSPVFGKEFFIPYFGYLSVGYTF